MEALGRYDAGGRTERGNEGAREDSTRIALPVLLSPLYFMRRTEDEGTPTSILPWLLQCYHRSSVTPQYSTSCSTELILEYREWVEGNERREQHFLACKRSGHG